MTIRKNSFVVKLQDVLALTAEKKEELA